MVKVASTSLSSKHETGDLVGWLDTRSNKFTVKGAYNLATVQEQEHTWEG